jgi:hypothetical protein
MPNGAVPRVFISYAHENRFIVALLAWKLKRRSIEVTYDDRDVRIGDRVEERLCELVQASDYLVLVLSARAASSEWVKYEVEVAIAEEKRRDAQMILTILLDDVELPEPLRERVFLKEADHNLRALCDRIAQKVGGRTYAELPWSAFELAWWSWRTLLLCLSAGALSGAAQRAMLGLQTISLSAPLDFAALFFFASFGPSTLHVLWSFFKWHGTQRALGWWKILIHILALLALHGFIGFFVGLVPFSLGLEIPPQHIGRRYFAIGFAAFEVVVARLLTRA